MNAAPAPARPLLIYDGQCAFCTRQARRLERWAAGGLELGSYHDPAVLARAPGLTLEDCDRAMQAVDTAGRVHAGLDALVVALRPRRPLLAGLVRLTRLPLLRALGDRAYAVLARRRRRIGVQACDTGCRLPPR